MEKKNKTGRIIVRVIVLVVVALILLIAIKPEWVPFISDETAGAIKASLKSTFLRTDGEGEKLLSLPTLISMAAVIAIVSIAAWLIRFVLERLTLKRNRSKTVAGLIISVTKYAAWLVAIIWCLSIAGVNVTGIFASIGILSLVIGFGAQSLIEDIITGIFIIFEGQYNVGDIIVLDDFRGTVKRIGVRTTNIEDAGGNIKIVNNSDIRNLQNRSQNLSKAVCDVGVSYSVRIEDVEKVLEKGLPGISAGKPELFLEPIKYIGVQELGASAVVLRLVAVVKEENVFSAQRAMNREIKVLFDDNGIEIPFMQVVLHDSKKK